MGSSTSQWKAIPPAQLAELFLINRFRTADCHSELPPIFDRHQFGTIIDMTSESLSTSVRNVYRDRPESAQRGAKRVRGVLIQVKRKRNGVDQGVFEEPRLGCDLP